MTLSRRTAFFSWLGLGTALAQQPAQWRTCNSKPNEIAELLDWEGRWGCKTGLRPPRNNQCPVCGTLAPEYKRAVEKELGFMQNCKPNPSTDPKNASTWWVACDPPHEVPVGPSANLTRCKTCNAAFWQDETSA